MKSQCSVASGRVSKRDLENEEIQNYLSKLKDLVPFMPKNRKLSKLQVIQYVIDYICDLQEALEEPSLQAIRGSPEHSPIRQPLGVLAPNTLVTSTSCSTQETTTRVLPFIEKPSPPDIRPVSV